MPKMTDDEVKDNIADGSIFAISLDTAVFGKPEDNLLDSPVLYKLDQFSGGPIRVIFSEIVTNEIKAHIADKAKRTQNQLKYAIKEQVKRWKLNFDLAALPDELAISRNPEEAAEEQVQNYLNDVDGEIVPASGENDVSVEVLRRYYATEPPFGFSENKKYEFPDAFALLSLEDIARQENRLLLCVSPDKGWQSFAEQSDFLVCVPKLELALSYFNESGRNVANRTVAMWQDEKAPKLAEQVERAFQRWLHNTGFYPDGSSDRIFEFMPIGADLLSVDSGTASVPIVIAADKNTVTFTIDVESLVAFEADCSFYVRDSIDRDYFEVGSDTYTVDKEIISQLVITILRDFDTEPQVVEVEVVKENIEVDFGYVAPFFHEEPEHEKY